MIGPFALSGPATTSGDFSEGASHVQICTFLLLVLVPGHSEVRCEGSRI